MKKTSVNRNGVKLKTITFIAICLAAIMCATSCSFLTEGINTLKDGDNTEQTDTASQNSSEKGGVKADQVAEKSELSKLIDGAGASDGKRSGIADIIDEIADSVVAINVSGTATDYFNRTYPTEGSGSGVIISTDGYIMTNNHVVTGGNSITVFLRNKESYPATVIGVDEETDIAVLKINKTGLAPARIGISSTLRIGDMTIAIGNPLGELQGTVTTGIVSALDRQITIDDRSMALMQTDAAINPGNSGGGLFDSNGDLIGIVTAKQSAAGIEGLGFFIPVDNAKPIVADLIESGYVTGRPSIGIDTITISSKYSAMINGVNWLGVYVYNMDSDGAAAKAGIKRADYISSVDGETISTEERFWEIINSKKIGDKVDIEIKRQNDTITITVTIQEKKS
ncbi:MAG: trypsin-like peptidase domain-containing protein [Oscillospiraceae bacterium]|nr:trypsin-like peptidase domain-containing protein [Oscillospiraceae bacterium]